MVCGIISINTILFYARHQLFCFINKKEENRYDDDDARMTALPRVIFCFRKEKSE
jgi:hypothetical protein